MRLEFMTRTESIVAMSGGGKADGLISNILADILVFYIHPVVIAIRRLQQVRSTYRY